MGGGGEAVGTNPATGMEKDGDSDPNKYSKGTQSGKVLIPTQV